MDAKSINGHIFTCSKCRKIHFEFNQIGIDFSSIKTIKDFYSFLQTINPNEHVFLNNSSDYIRKIHIPFPGTAIKLVLSKDDLIELIDLLKRFINNQFINHNQPLLIKKLSQLSARNFN